MDNKNFTGTINPYALAEIITEKRIDWNSFDEPQKVLSDIINVTPEAIFDADSPILMPDFITDEKNHVRRLDFLEKADRLRTYVRRNQQNVKRRSILPNGQTMEDPAVQIERVLTESFNTIESSPSDDKKNDFLWVDKGDYFEDIAEMTDPVQGAVGDCYLIAALSSVVWSRPYAIVNAARPSTHGNDHSPVHLIRFYDTKNQIHEIEATEYLPVQKHNQSWIYARSADRLEIWPGVIEKAYAMWKTGNTDNRPSYEKISGGDPVLACQTLIGGRCNYLRHEGASEVELTQFIRSNCLGGRTVNPMVTWTYQTAPTGCDYHKARIVAYHAYSILGWEYRNGQYYVVLRNPWNTHEGVLDTLSGDFTSEGKFYARIRLNRNGIFAMKMSTFKKYFYKSGVVT